MSAQREHIEAELKRLHAELDSLASQAERTQKLLLARRRELIAITCPWKVGQRLTTARGKEFEISRIEASRVAHDKDTQYAVFAHSILKGGTLHKNERELYSWDLPKGGE